MTSNVDALINTVYKDGFIRHNKYAIDMGYVGGEKINVPAYGVRIPGWDISTVTESNVAGGPFRSGASVKNFPYRKNWRQELFITFFMEKNLDTYAFINAWANSVAAPAGPRPYYESQVRGNYLPVKVGQDADDTGQAPPNEPSGPDITHTFEEAFPRVVYPIELKPIEDVSPFIFSVQFNYRYYDVYSQRGQIIG